MGGRGATSGIKVMTEEEYLSSKGYAFMGYADAGLHISNSRISDKVRSRDVKRVQEKAREYDSKRAELRKEYNQLVKEGKVRAPTTYERIAKTAKGNPERADVQAARRLLEKYKQRMKKSR
ncbi:MAG: hypothetical protein IJ690_07680 [Clostridia bacterium]|nr:hypothetical protein [Clostridia bacterium]MBR1654786.1 hypothetical protein [Clostridia bacterium]